MILFNYKATKKNFRLVWGIKTNFASKRKINLKPANNKFKGKKNNWLQCKYN